MARFRTGEYDPAKFSDTRGLAGTITVNDRVLRSMRAWSRSWSPLETSGALMWVDRGASASVVLAGPCGPGGDHERLTSCPRLEYFNHCISLARHGRPEIFCAGVWHTHPFQDEPLPSPRDLWGVKEESDGYFGWDRANFEGLGHVEAIMARKKTRFWYVRGDAQNPWVNEVWLLCEFDIGIDVAFHSKERSAS